MRVLIVGGGGREHALAWKLSQSKLLERLFCAPGNAGIASLAETVDIDTDNIELLHNWVVNNRIDLTVVGPERPLTMGIADRLRSSGMAVFGPGKDGALLEGSKIWAKERMREWSIPTPDFAVFDDFDDARYHLSRFYGGPVVIKADGLAAGKGVTVAAGPAEAEQALHDIMVEKIFGDAGKKVLIEKCLYGQEVSVLAVTDGNNLAMIPSAQDHKAIGEGDQGPNTGGMGAYAPAPLFTADLAEKARTQVFLPLLHGFKSLNIDFRGVIYAGLMISDNLIKVLEFNVRFGDPETQVILPLLKSDLLELLSAAAQGNISDIDLEWSNQSAVCVVLASQGYPGRYENGFPIDGLESAAAVDERQVALFHAGTASFNDRIITSGGRVLGVTAWDSSLHKAVELVYRAAGQIDFDGCYYRRDIAHRALRKI